MATIREVIAFLSSLPDEFLDKAMCNTIYLNETCDCALVHYPTEYYGDKIKLERGKCKLGQKFVPYPYNYEYIVTEISENGNEVWVEVNRKIP